MDGKGYIGYWIRDYTTLCFFDWVSGRRLGHGVNDQGHYGQYSTGVKHRISENKFIRTSLKFLLALHTLLTLDRSREEKTKKNDCEEDEKEERGGRRGVETAGRGVAEWQRERITRKDKGDGINQQGMVLGT
jgi:hypothetical protein